MLKPGWPTTQPSKPESIDAFAEAFETGEFIPNDPKLIEEMIAFEIQGNQMGVAQGRHDDRVMSAAIAWTAGLRSVKMDRPLFIPAAPQGSAFYHMR